MAERYRVACDVMITNDSLQLTDSRYGSGLQISAFWVAAREQLDLLGPRGLSETALLNLIAGILPPEG